MRIKIYKNIVTDEEIEQIEKSLVQHLLFIASMISESENSLSFKLLVNKFGIDKEHTDKHGNNLMIIACTLNENVGFIRYLIEKIGFDPMKLNKIKSKTIVSQKHVNQIKILM